MQPSLEKQDKFDKVRNYMIAGAAGVVGVVVAAAATIRQEFDQDMASVPAINKIRRDTRTDLREKDMKFTKVDEATRTATRSDHLNTLHEIKETARTAERDLLEKMGFRSKGWTGLTYGTVDRLKQMSSESRALIFLSSTVTAAVLAGATYTFFNNNHTRAKLDELSEQLNARDVIQAR